MKIKLLLVAILLSIGLSSQTVKKVLFIGNSYTASNNLPQIIKNAALSVGDTLIFAAHTPGGARLLNHSSNSATINKIYSDNWDHVVIQAQSQEPSFGDSLVAADVFPHARILCDTIRANDSCTRPVFYMTWGRENGDALNCPFIPWVCTYEGMDSVLSKNYRYMADTNNALVSPVGAVWRYIRTNYPAVQLYAGDGSHPSQTGSYVAACTFYSILFRKDPTLITYNFSLSSTDAANIRQAAKLVVYDSLLNWNVGKYDPIADFNPNLGVVSQLGATVNFINMSVNGLSYTWNFGDGNSSTQKNPDHLYTSNGTYDVTMIVENCDGIDSITKQVILYISLNDQPDFKELKIFPNPATTYFSINDELNRRVQEVIIYGIRGKMMFSQIVGNDQRADITSLSNGTYLVNLKFESGEFAQKLLVISK